MTPYYAAWLLITARIDQLHFTLFCAVLTGYWVYRWNLRARFSYLAASFLATVCLGVEVGLCRW